MKPLLLDLCCAAGGASRGYATAGFEVMGVDIVAQPNYPYLFIRADAMQYLAATDVRANFDAVHASPPCNAYTHAQRIRARTHPDLVGPMRELLLEAGLPYVIENVKGAPLRDPQVLEGQMFGLNTHRPRLFETNWGYEAPLLRPPPPRSTKMGRAPRPGEAVQVVGNFSDVEAGRRAMGIDWMTRNELKLAIPPAYTHHIGAALLAHLNA